VSDAIPRPAELAVLRAAPAPVLASGHVSDHLRWLRHAVPGERLFAPRVALLLPSTDGERLVVDAGGQLPWADVELETSLLATAQGLAAGIGLDGTPGSFEPVAALAGRAWWEDGEELGPLAPVWVVVRVEPAASSPATGRREVKLGSVPLGATAVARAESPARDATADAGPAIAGDYIGRVRRHIGTARIFYPWGGMALRDADGRLLLVRLAEQAQWHCPGGGMEDWESAEATARRELLEETGLVGRPGRLLGCFSGHVRSFANGDRIQGVALFMEGHVDGGTIRPDPTGEIDAMGWFAADDLPPLHRPWDARVRLALTGRGARFG
jgi:ADP-ribose pyrophosphatase YjhB (NUDIX family)